MKSKPLISVIIAESTLTATTHLPNIGCCHWLCKHTHTNKLQCIFRFGNFMYILCRCARDRVVLIGVGQPSFTVLVVVFFLYLFHYRESDSVWIKICICIVQLAEGYSGIHSRWGQNWVIFRNYWKKKIPHNVCACVFWN